MRVLVFEAGADVSVYARGRRLQLVEEHSYNEEMRKHTLRGKLFAATVGRKVNNRLATFRW